MLRVEGVMSSNVWPMDVHTKDKSSTGNLIKHVKACRGWGEEIWAAATACGTAKEARETVTKPGIKMSGSILASFARKGKGKVTYSHRNHTKTETKYVPPSYIGVVVEA